MKPYFSIIIPTLNEEKFLPRLLRSIAEQTDTDFEVIVSDGSSMDATIEKAKSMNEKLPCLRIIKSTIAGQSLQRNLGAEHAKGTWIVFVDADSILMPYCLSRLRDYIQQNKPSFLTSWFQTDSDENAGAVYALLGNLFVESYLLLKRAIAPGPFMCIKHSVFDRIGGFDVTLSWGEDFDITKKIERVGIPLDVIREVLYVHSIRRIQNEGKLRWLQTYARAAIVSLVTNKTLRSVPGYVMGGHIYASEKQKKLRESALDIAEKRIRVILKDLTSFLIPHDEDDKHKKYQEPQ